MEGLFDSAEKVSRDRERFEFVRTEPYWFEKFRRQKAPYGFFVKTHRKEIDADMARRERMQQQGFGGLPRWAQVR